MQKHQHFVESRDSAEARALSFHPCDSDPTPDLGEHAPFTRVFIIGQTKQWVNNTNNAPSPSNKRGADQQEQIKIEVVKRCVLTPGLELELYFYF